MGALPFVKMHGAGNDFVMLDGRDLERREPLEPAQIAALCGRRTGIGADGLIIMTAVEAGKARMVYYNSDGGEADMCGNGARCTVAFAHACGILGRRGLLATRCGELVAIVHGPSDIEVSLPGFRDLDLEVAVAGSPFVRHHHCNTGVPHLVIPVRDIEDLDILEQGRVLRHAPQFAPAGVNVNWIAADPGSDEWLLRTYERGVEAETLACGTGASAAAVTLVSDGAATTPVAIRTRGGDLLHVAVDLESGGLRLRGPTVVAYTGEVAIP